MPQFRWHLKHELALLKELTANKPATAKDWATTWKRVSNGINQAMSVATTPRSCRDHFNNALLSKFNKDNRDSLKRYTLFIEGKCIRYLIDQSLFVDGVGG